MILHQNAQEVTNKIERLIHLAESTDPNIIILTEHGLKPEQIESGVLLPGYTLKTHFSRKNHRKGGVAIYVRNNLELLSDAVEISQYSQEIVCEVVVLKIHTLQKKFT